jgi:hypothetical protein
VIASVQMGPRSYILAHALIHALVQACRCRAVCQSLRVMVWIDMAMRSLRILDGGSKWQDRRSDNGKCTSTCSMAS